MQLKLPLRGLALLLFLTAASGSVEAVPQQHRAAEERWQSGAGSAPGAAWHHLLLGQEAAREGRKAEAIRNYRIAASLDPDLI